MNRINPVSHGKSCKSCLRLSSSGSPTDEFENYNRLIASTDIFRLHHRRRLQQRSWLVHLAGIDRANPRRSGPVYANAFPSTRMKISFEDRRLGADVEDVPALESVDGFVRH